MTKVRGVPVALLALAAAYFLLHIFTNGQYGFHRDELQTLDDAAHLDWGFVAYPPLTPSLARLAVAMFGPTLIGVRAFAALAVSLVVFVAGLMAREMGGSARAQLVAAVAVAASPMSMIGGHLLQYVSWDFLWCSLLFYCALRVLRSEDERWWLAAGATAGLGLMTRYTILWSAAGVVIGFLVTPARRFLWSRWFAAGVALALLIAMPNLLWQVRHDLISLEFTRSIHAHDVSNGRTDGFWWRQLVVPASPFTIPLWIAGLYSLFRKADGARYKALGWSFAATVILFAAVQARDYYTAPLYPMLLAAGAVASERWTRGAKLLSYAGLAAALGFAIAFLLPLAPPGSRWFQTDVKINNDLREEIGWQDLVDRVAQIRDSLPPEERAHAGVLTGNYGEAGAINLYGPRYALPHALSSVNSMWLRGYGSEPPQTLIVVGLSPRFVRNHFVRCDAEGTISNRLGVPIEETEDDKYLWICRGLRESWPDFWMRIRAWE